MEGTYKNINIFYVDIVESFFLNGFHKKYFAHLFEICFNCNFSLLTFLFFENCIK